MEAKTKIVIDVGEGAKSIRQLKQEFKEGQKELEGLTVGTDQYVKQLKHLANVKDEIDDLNKAITAFRPDQKLGALVGVGRGIAAGFEAATAASALFGAEAQDVEKTLVKVQSAMALANAVQEVGELGKQFQLMGTVLKSMIGSTGIGLLVIAIAAIATYWDDIKYSITGVNSEMEDELDLAKENVNAQKEKLTAIDKQENILKLQGKSEEDILRMKKEQTYQIIQSQIKQLEQQIYMQKVQEETSKKNQDILAGILKWVGGPINLILLAIDKISGFVGEATHLADDFAKFEAGLIFNPDKIAEEGKKANAELIKQLQEEANNIAGFQLQIQNIEKQSYEKRKAEALKNEDELKKIREKHKEWMQEDSDFFNQLDADNADESIKKWKAQKDAEYQIMLDAEQSQTALAKAQAGERGRIREAELSIATSVVSSLGSLAQLSGEQGEAMIEFQKGLAIAQIAIDTAKAISSTIAGATAAAAETGPAAPFTLVAYIASGIATVLANIVKAKQILSQAGGAPSLNLPSGAAGGGGSVRPPSLNQVGSTSTNLDNLQNGNHRITQPTVKAVVVETDITANQKRIAKIIDKSKH